MREMKSLDHIFSFFKKGRVELLLNLCDYKLFTIVKILLNNQTIIDINENVKHIS